MFANAYLSSGEYVKTTAKVGATKQAVPVL